MASQTLTAVALPAGTRAGRAAAGQHLPVAAAVRRRARCRIFPDWLDWPELSSSTGCRSPARQRRRRHRRCHATRAAAARHLAGHLQAARPPSAPYPRPDFGQRLSCPIRQPTRTTSSSTPTDRSEASPAGDREGELLQDLLESLMFRDGRESILDSVLSELPGDDVAGRSSGLQDVTGACSGAGRRRGSRGA